VTAPLRRPLRVLLVYALTPESRTFSYQRGWPRSFAQHPAFDVTPLDVARPFATARASFALRRHRLDAVVLLHSAFSNQQNVRGALLELLSRSKAPKVLFLGNEFKLMPEKMAFAEKLGVSLLVSQLHSPRAHELYRARLGCEVLELPYTGLDASVFRPGPPWWNRPVDLGYRSVQSPLYLGHRERDELVEQFAEAGARRGLVTDLSLDPAARFDEAGWAAFLNRCKAQLGSEAGADYFELSDETRYELNRWAAQNPSTTVAAARARILDRHPDAVPGRALSGRVVEAAGTKTVQLLLVGEHGGFFAPDEHYVPVRKDFGDVDEALEKLRDREYCTRLVDQAYTVAHAELTYSKLLDRLASAVAEVAGG
jgi:hypothetical protein